MSDFLDGYRACIEWLTIDNPDWRLDELGDIDADAPEWSQEALDIMEKDCDEFQRVCNNVLTHATKQPGYDYSYAGHDYWLTRNGHGVGFWDREALNTGSFMEDGSLYTIGELLTKHSQYQEQHVYRGDDGLLYLA